MYLHRGPGSRASHAGHSTVPQTNREYVTQAAILLSGNRDECKTDLKGAQARPGILFLYSQDIYVL